MRLRVALAGIAVIGSILSGCADLTPIQSQLKDLSGQVARLSSEQAAMRATLDNTARSAREAEEAAKRASSKADQALALAQSNKNSIDATNEKIDRMFRRHLSK